MHLYYLRCAVKRLPAVVHLATCSAYERIERTVSCWGDPSLTFESTSANGRLKRSSRVELRARKRAGSTHKRHSNKRWKIDYSCRWRLR